jgi:hypothetical protein
VAPPASGVKRTGRGPAALSPLLTELAAGREPTSAPVTPELLAIAREHRMAGLLWTWLREQEVDPAIKRDLAMYDLFVQGHQERVWSVLESSVARLQTAGVDVAAIKGVTAEARWYGRRGERPCSDVDLLLSPYQLNQAASAVAALQPDHPWLPHVNEMAASAQVQAVTMLVDGLEVDLHFDLLKLGFPSRQPLGFWARTRRYPLRNGTRVHVLDDTAALLHLLVHLNKDRFQRLLGFADVARIVLAGHVEWSALVRLAERDGIEIPVLRTLEVVVDELDLPWPGGIARPRGPRSVLWSALWRPSIRLRGREGRLRFRHRQDWIRLLARGRAIESIGWWMRELAPPRPTVDAHYAHVRGPYLWKLVRGRTEAVLLQRRRLADIRGRSIPPDARRPG